MTPNHLLEALEFHSRIDPLSETQQLKSLDLPTPAPWTLVIGGTNPRAHNPRNGPAAPNESEITLGVEDRCQCAANVAQHWAV